MPSPFALPPLKQASAEDEARLADALSRLHEHCRARANAQAPFGTAYMTWKMDLRRLDLRVRRAPDGDPARLERFTFTARKNEREEPVAAELAFDFAGGEERFFLGEWITLPSVQTYLSGDEFERTFPAGLAQPVPAQDWDLWGRGATAAIGRHYEDHIYPPLVDTVRAIAARAPGRALVVADLGGGSGALADMICDGVPQARPVLVVDRSPALVQQAERRAVMHPGRMLVRCADIGAEGFLDALEPAPDVAVLCGVVAQQVMDREAGLRLVRALFAKLPASGFLLVPSFSPALLTADDYEATGFAVHNRTLNLVETGPGGRTTLRTNDFYVLEKR